MVTKKVKDEFPHEIAYFLIVALVLAVTVIITYMMGTLQNDVRESNRLLSGFQRIDAVKSPKAEWFAADGKFMGLPRCTSKVTSHCYLLAPTENSGLDPSTCSKWTSECSDGECDSICHLKPE